VRVLVTGAAGFIGRAVCEQLTARGDEPAGFDRPHDVTDTDQVADALAGCDAVINLAGALGTGELFGAEQMAVHTNIIGALVVYDAAARLGVPVVQIGTGHKGQPNPYAITKAAAEDLGLARAQYRAERIVIVRAYHAYGPGQKMCPPHGRSPVRKIVPSMVCRALTGMDVEINGSGEQLVDLVHVDDIAAVLVDAVTAAPGTVLEAGTGKPTRVLDVAADILAVTGSTSRIRHIPTRPGEPADAEVVAREPRCHNPWPHRLDETVAWYRDQLG
jgi:UDP-glucose 4-epimerase